MAARQSVTDLNHGKNRVPQSESKSARGKAGNSRGRFRQGKDQQAARPSSATPSYYEEPALARNDACPSDREKNLEEVRGLNDLGRLDTRVGVHPALDDVSTNGQSPSRSVDMLAGKKNEDQSSQDSATSNWKLRQMIQSYLQGGPDCTRFDSVPLEIVQNILEQTETETLPSVTSNLVYCTHIEDGPSKFTLRWKREEDRLQLINFVLLDRIKTSLPDERIYPVDMQQYTRENFIGKMVAARRGSSENFARGIVKEFINENSVLIYFLDYGNTDEIQLDRLMTSPLEFLQIKPLCFNAYLADLSSDVMSSDVCKLKFEEMVTDGEMQCTAKRSDRGPLWEVHLLKKFRSGTGSTDISKYLNEHYSSEPKPDEKVMKNPFISDPQQPSTSRKESLRPDRIIETPGDVTTKSADTSNDVESSPPAGKSSSSSAYNEFMLKQKQKQKQPNVYSVKIEEARGGSPGCTRELKILYIVSPSEFYVQFRIDHGNNSQPMWLEKFQDTYSTLQRSKRLRQVKEVQPKQCFGWREHGSRKWNRVSVVTSDGKNCEVFLVDEGRKVTCLVKDLRELPEGFDSQSLSSRVHLADIKPPGTHWSEESIELFRKWCSDAVLKSAILPDQDKILKGGFFKVSYGIVLAGVNDMGRTFVGTAQSALCKNGLALPLGISCGRHDLPYLSQANIPTYQRDKLEEELQLTIENEERQLSYSTEGSASYLRRSLQLQIGYLEISAVNGPGNFYIQLVRKSHELYNMETQLRSLIKELTVLPINQFSIGGIVFGCDYSSRDSSEDERNWFRVAIISINIKDRIALSVSIDHGFELYIDMLTARKLPEYICSVPPFCHRAHLDFPAADKIYTPSNTMWMEDADGVFRRYVESFKEDFPQYYGWQVRPSNSSVIVLEELNQKVIFDEETQQWQAGRPMKIQEYLLFNKCRENPLLKHLFVSIGIDVKYELVHHDVRHVELKPAWDVLLDLGFIVEK